MSMKRVYLAIDAHARHCVLGSMNSQGEFLGTQRFVTGETELIRHIEAIDARQKILAIEEGPLAYWIAQTLRPYVSDIVICDPRENPLIARNAVKGDKVDAKHLCRLLRLGELKRVYHPEDDHRAVFEAAVQHYIDLRNQQTSLKQKIKAKYRAWGGADVHGTSLYHPEKLQEYLSKIALPAIRNQIRRLYSVLGVTVDMQVAALKETRRLAHRYPEIKEFMKVPGVGIIGALTFDAYIHTPHRFARKSPLWRYCKLGVTDRSSDGKPLSYKRLDKAGNGELKAMSYRAFLGALRKKNDNEVRQFYTASLQRTRNHTRARLNTQRKILSVLHGVWRRKERYRPELFLGSE